MSTNFYWDEPDATEDRKHIGKRSGAGPYCWTCRRTMCVDGEAAVHLGRSAWYDKCPGCGATREADPSTGQKGLGYACSFTWAEEPDEVLTQCALEARAVVDEYERRLTGREFLSMLKGCPIWFLDLVGKEFL